MKRFLHAAKCIGVSMLLAGLVFAGCAGSTPEPGVVFPCAPDGKIEKSIAPEAELVDFSCIMKKWEGSDTLHFNVVVKNISDQPQRYRVNIFLDNGKAVGGLIPRSTKAGLVDPGKTASFEYPVGGMDHLPRSIMLIVKTLAT
jgi:hypothetical protein